MAHVASRVRYFALILITILSLPSLVAAQDNDGSGTFAQANPDQAVPIVAGDNDTGQAGQDVADTARRFRFGVLGGVGLDPELVVVGAHGHFGPVFRRDIFVRPGVELGIGEITTMLGINVDVLYTLPGTTADSRWLAYVGGGPTFGLSHRGFETDEGDKVTVTGVPTTVTDRNRFDFSDTDFNGGVNFIAGARNQRGWLFELRATAWGVSNIRLLTGFNF